MADQRAWPMTLPNSRAQLAAYPTAKPSLWPFTTLGHSLLPRLITESSHSLHTVGEHSLSFRLARSSCRVQRAALPNCGAHCDSDLMGSTACKLAEPDVNVELSWRPYLMPWPIREPSQRPGLNVEPRQLGYPTMKPSQQHHRTAPNLRAWAVASPD